MASISASAPTSSITGTTLAHKRLPVVSSSPVLGLPAMAMKGKVRFSMEEKPRGCNKGMSASLVAAACAVTTSSPALALVDERLSTEGTGLPFGLSNNLLGWILFGVFGLIWALYFVYTSSLDEDEESGLSL
ncbi:photosystem II reaction center W protein, chloroplastic [Jatropha curcas]|nr:photosystem II reaction center W protein, chloroplastic [Jatropha curcas]